MQEQQLWKLIAGKLTGEASVTEMQGLNSGRPAYLDGSFKPCPRKQIRLRARRLNLPLLQKIFHSRGRKVLTARENYINYYFVR